MSKEIIFIHSGLGNQMFQYAFYLSRKQNNPNALCNMGLLTNRNIHNGFELNRIFGTNIRSLAIHTFLLRCIYHSKFFAKFIKLIGISEITDKSFCSLSSNATIKYFSGYWQSEKYFKHIENKVRKAFLFPIKLLNKDSRRFELMIQGSESVSIHIRRGDYCSPQNVSIYGNICTLDYYKKAIKIIKEAINNPTFYIFSNDIDWVKENLDIPSSIFINCNKGNDSWQDMYLMSKCKHNIIANSTFSWWGAWLNNNQNKIVIGPHIFDNVGASPDIFPEKWIKIQP